MKPQAGQFDLRTIDDGQPAANVRSGRGKAVLFASLIVGLVGFALGAGMGMASVGRANMNTANHAAKSVKAELDSMQKTLTQIGTALAMSAQRMAKDKKEPLTYDPALIADLEKIKLDPRPDTSKIFRVDYFRLEDVVVDRLFNYYYDSIALYNETERHIKKTKADQESLAAFATKQAAAGAEKIYGVVFDTSSQDHRRQSRRGRRAGLQERRQGLRRRGFRRLQGPLEHRRALGRPQVGRQARHRQGRPDQVDAADGGRDVGLARPGAQRGVQAARGQPARHRQPPHQLAEGAVRGDRQGREPAGRLRAVLDRGR